MVPTDESPQPSQSSPGRPVIISEKSLRWPELGVHDLYPPPDFDDYDIIPLLGHPVSETGPASDFIHEDVDPAPGLDYEPWGIVFKDGRWSVPDSALE